LAAGDEDHAHALAGHLECPSARCAHGIRHSPKHVLLDVKVKRDILRMAAWAEQIAGDDAPIDIQNPVHAHNYGYRLGGWHAYKDVLYALAAPYNDHPDYIAIFNSEENQ
jgi:hypothetical protein